MSENQLISFRVGAETYVHPIEHIREIISYDEPVPVPGAPPTTEGILNVRGTVITVFSGRTLLDEARMQGNDDWRIVILELDSGQIGISVDAVGNMLHFHPDEVEWNATDNSQQQLIKGTLQRSGTLYILTDFSNLNISGD